MVEVHSPQCWKSGKIGVKLQIIPPNAQQRSAPLLVTGVDMLWIRDMTQKAMNIAANWALEQELQFSSKKTEIELFNHKRNPDLGS